MCEYQKYEFCKSIKCRLLEYIAASGKSRPMRVYMANESTRDSVTAFDI